MKISVKKTIRDSILGILLSILVFLASGNNIKANEQSLKNVTYQPTIKSDFAQYDMNDPNGSWWKKWDATIKDPNDPNEIIQAKWNSIITILQNKDLDQELKKKIIDKIISPVFDTDLMAKLVLGRTNWPKLNASQQKRFTILFAERLKNFYLEKTALYNDQTVTFKPATRNRSSVYIPMVLTSNNQEVSILYKLHKLNEADLAGAKIYWKIYDVEIEGVSVLLTYQSQFDDILRKGSVNDLFEQLEKPSTE